MYKREYRAFQAIVEGRRPKFSDLVIIALKSLSGIVEWIIRDIPGPLGILIRRGYYKIRLRHLGRGVIIDTGVLFIGAKDISIADYAWIDAFVKFEAMLGQITVGRRVHIASFVVLGAREPIEIQDYAAVASGAKIYSNSESPKSGLRMSGPMIPERHKAFVSQRVVIGRDAVVGANSVLLPGACLATGAVLGANSTLKVPIPEWEIWAGSPARTIGVREPVKS